MQNHGAYGGTPKIVVQSQYDYVEQMESSIVRQITSIDRLFMFLFLTVG